MDSPAYTSSGKENVSIEYISPQRAAEYLKHNINNRKYREKYSNTLAKQWKKGHFLAGVGSISFDENNRLVDGQHRLNAIIKSGLTLKFVVVRNLHNEVFSVIDSGIKRSGSDVIAIFDSTIKNSNNVAALCTGVLSWRKSGPTNNDPLNSNAFDVDNQDKLHFYAENKENIHKSVTLARTMNKVGSPAVKAWSCFIFEVLESGVDPKKLDEFLHYIYSYQASPQSPSTLLLAQKLVKDLGRSPRLYTSNNGLALMIKSWNAFINEKDMKILRWNHGENFPVLVKADA